MIKYIDMSPALFFVHFCLTEEELAVLVDSANDETRYYGFPTTGANVRRVSPKVGGQVEYIVCVSKEAQNVVQQTTLAGLLVHEAVHLWQYYVEDVLETTPDRCGSEQVAYGIQYISTTLMEEYVRKKFGVEIPYTSSVQG